MDIVFYQFALDLQKDNWCLQIIKKNKIQFLFYLKSYDANPSFFLYITPIIIFFLLQPLSMV